MKPEQQRIAIAEACGWTNCTSGPFNQCYGNEPRYLGSESEAVVVAALPDYLNDLNAMHEAERAMRLDDPMQADSAVYHMKLSAICGSSKHRMVHATASQRAEAFLRTIGKWTE